MSWKYLSYELSEELSGYGNGDRIAINKVRRMCCGDTSNNTAFSMPTHFGTHMDFPFHFAESGKNQSNYQASQLVFTKVCVQHLDLRTRENKLISPADLKANYPRDTEILLLKTSYSDLRGEEIYWKNNPGFQPETAGALKERMPLLKAIAFDSISLTNFQNRELGRVAHKSFLMEHDLLIIEDVNLSEINEKSQIRELVIAPLRMRNADGAPVTIFAKVDP